jgi:hypothetical protein
MRGGARVLDAIERVVDAPVAHAQPRRVTRATETAIWTTPHGATWCAGAFAARKGDGVVVLVGHITNGGERSVTVLALDAKGARRADVEALTLPETSAYLATAVVSGERVVLALARRRDEELGEATILMHDHPSFIGLGSHPWKPRVLSSRDDLDVSWMAAATRGRETAWAMGLVSWTSTVPSTHLGYGYATGTNAPEIRATDIPCSSSDHVCTERGALALVATKRQADLWLLERSGAPKKVVDAVAVAKNRRELGDVRLAQLRDGFACVWYLTPNGSYDDGGGLYARTVSSDLSELGPLLRLARVDEASWREWRAADVGDGALVLFGSGDAGDPLKQLRVRTRADLEVEARTIPGKLPIALAATRDGAVAITEKKTAGGRKTTLQARMMPL